MVNVTIGSPVGAYSTTSTPFFRYIVRLNEAELEMSATDRDAIDLLAAIPHAFFDDDEAVSGNGWRVVPPTCGSDWPVLEATPQRIRNAFQVARRLLWRNAGPVGISAADILGVDEEIEKVLGVVASAEAAGFSVNVTYVS